jgi:hypothetical protein
MFNIGAIKYIVTILLSLILSLNAATALEQTNSYIAESSYETSYCPILLTDFERSYNISEKGQRQISLDSLYQLLSELSVPTRQVKVNRTILSCKLDDNATSILKATLDSCVFLLEDINIKNNLNTYILSDIHTTLISYKELQEIKENKEARAYLYWALISLISLCLIIVANIKDFMYLQLFGIIVLAISLIVTLYYLQVIG